MISVQHFVEYLHLMYRQFSNDNPQKHKYAIMKRNSDGKQFHQQQQKEQFTSRLYLTEKKTTTNDVVNPGLMFMLSFMFVIECVFVVEANLCRFSYISKIKLVLLLSLTGFLLLNQRRRVLVHQYNITFSVISCLYHTLQFYLFNVLIHSFLE